jgi:hypothetical protein
MKSDVKIVTHMRYNLKKLSVISYNFKFQMFYLFLGVAGATCFMIKTNFHIIW